MVEIVRGGSPRPIKDYLTSEVDGINWIKIGDTEKGEKYINNVKEKIKKSGLNKTRFVKKGTFLLTNSMSFGRPYILNVDGAIHDGWLAISNYENSLNKDYLFYILSSNVVYSQFLSLISGAVVKNLNSDKVASISYPYLAVLVYYNFQHIHLLFLKLIRLLLLFVVVRIVGGEQLIID